MKKILRIFILFLYINISSFVLSQKTEAQAVSFQVFYDDLSPYGSWRESPDYGYVWCPRVSGFSPYSTNGYWVLTDEGWTWVSDYSWGWAPFHYGRWYYDPIYGYVWVPGYEWGPGWVSWRRSNDYYGWAPIGPGIDISVAYSNGYNVPYDRWNFVRCNNFGRRDIHNYYIDRSKNVTIINNTTVINVTKVDNTRKTTFAPGPDRMEVQKKVGRTINPVAIVDENKPTQRISKNTVQLYRPVIEKNDTKKPVPAKLTPLHEDKPQVNNTTLPKNNQAINERKAKQPLQVNPVKPSENQQPVRQNNNQPAKEPQQPVKKPVRDEQPTQPIRQAPVQKQDKINNEPARRQPVQQQPIRKPANERPVQPVQPQRNDERPIQQQQPVRQQNVEPQQRQPERQMPVRQQPVRQAPPVQREIHAAPPPQGDKKGGK